MNRIVTSLMGIAILVIIVICALNMLGLGDLVKGAGDKIRQTTVGQAAPADPAANSEADEFAKRALGWDIRDINKKPAATIRQGIAKLTAKIDELERLKEQARAADKKAGRTSAAEAKELSELRDALREAKRVLSDPSTTYPVKMKNYTYASEEMLLSSFDKMNARYQSLKETSTYTANNPAQTAQTVMKIEAQVRLARSMMDLLLAKLEWAENMELGESVASNEDDLNEFSSRAASILSDPLDLPVGPANESERMRQSVLDFND